MALVSLCDVDFTYTFAKRPALKSITLDIEPGRLYGVVGTNGSGKSTLCSVIRGTIPHFHPGELKGDVVIRGKSTHEWDASELSNAIGYVFQNPFTQISGIKDTVFEEVALGLENLGVERDELIGRVLDVISRVGIDGLAKKNPNELSGGQRQLVAFASIIAMDADFIIIDEPTSQLDPETSESVFSIIADLKKQGKTIILVEHKIDLLAEYADSLIVMEHGEIVLNGPTRTVLMSDQLIEAEVNRPELTQLGVELERAGKPLSDVPMTRANARDLVSDRIQEVRHADRTH